MPAVANRSQGNSTNDTQNLAKTILLTPSSLKQLLTSSLQPVETIAQIQRDTSWGKVAERLQNKQQQSNGKGVNKKSLYGTLKKLAQFERLLPILDVHKYSRASLFKKIYEELNAMLLDKLRENPNTKHHNAIINDCLREHENPLVAKVLMYLLENSENISPKHLEIISENTSLYNICSLKIKQQIWFNNRQLFFKEITFLMNEAISKDQDFYRQLTIQNPFTNKCQLLFNLDSTCNTLASYVSKFPELYEITVELIIDSYEQSGQDSIYSLFLFSFNHSLIKESPEENFANNLSYDILSLLNSPSCRDSSGSLNGEFLKDIVDIIDNLNVEDQKNLKLAFMVFSSPLFIHMLFSTLTKIYADLVEQSTLPKNSKELQMVLYILSFCCQDINLDDTMWALKLPDNMQQQIYTKLIPVLLNLQLSMEKKISSSIKISNEVKTLAKKSSAASFLVMHTLSTCLKKVSIQASHISKSNLQPNNAINSLVAFVKDFEPAIRSIAPQHCLELMNMMSFLVKMKPDLPKTSAIVFFQSLLFPWLKSANYPANFIMIKLMNCFKDILDAKQWKFVKEIASELDHEEFCKLHNKNG